MLTLNNYIEKTATGEVRLGEIPQAENYILYLENGDITPLLKLEGLQNVFVPNLPFSDLCHLEGILFEQYVTIITLDKKEVETLIEQTSELSTIKNLLPNFSPYINKESAILFLSEEEANKYGYFKNKENKHNFSFCGEWNNKTILPFDAYIGKDGKEYEGFNFQKLTIITNSIHAENINQINETCKELKEKYGVEYIELVATHCYFGASLYFGKDQLGCRSFEKNRLSIDYPANLMALVINDEFVENLSFNKIITTNSTRILEPQKSEHLEVINCEEFFKNI